ncbi:MAG: cisplatin damage response ATP-dependent DNA ligase [Saprospiraceae bacterium]|jgi:DNA ligase-1|nr:cisplatin damage response ATP-dependent DNA ligase [Saprospiraceae bacterium]
MKTFSEMIRLLEGTSDSIQKINLISGYLTSEKNDKDRVWAIGLLLGIRPTGIIPVKKMRQWCIGHVGIPIWLYDFSHQITGDHAETIGLMVASEVQNNNLYLHNWIEKIQQVQKAQDDQIRELVMHAWSSLENDSVYIFNKLITGQFRIKISKNIIVEAVCKTTGQDINAVSYHLMKDWHPDQIYWQQLFNFENSESRISNPYPFSKIYAIHSEEVETITPEQWVALWLWDGIRCQLIVRKGEIHIRTMGEELITNKLPEFGFLQGGYGDFVIEGVMVSWIGDKPIDSEKLLARMSRKYITKKVFQSIPAVFIAEDLLEEEMADIRFESYEERRSRLKNLMARINNPNVLLSPLIEFNDRFALAYHRNKARETGAIGLILKKKTAKQRADIVPEEIWEWKNEPYTIDAVLIYAHRSLIRGNHFFSDFTFALWDGDNLIPVAKAFSGLGDDEIIEISAWIKSHKIESFGPVVSVHPDLVFELSFECVSNSARHKSGIVLRLPRIVRWNRDKLPEDAHKLADLKSLIIV